jgi:hypothetical protein
MLVEIHFKIAHTYLLHNKRQIYEQRIRWDKDGFLEDV